MSEASATPIENKPQNKQPKPARRRRKWLIAGGIVVLLLLVVMIFAALLPTLFSGGFMHGTLHRVADDAVQGKITWSKLDVKWGKGQRIEDLVVADAQGNAILTMAKVDAPDVSLWSIVWGNKNLGTITAVLDSARIIQEADGEYNIAKALTSTPSSKPSSPKQSSSSTPSEPLSGWKAAFVFQGSDIQITPLEAPAVTVKSINLSGDLQDPAAIIALTFDTAIEQNQQAAGNAQGTVTLNDLMDAQGNLQLAKARIDAQMSFNQLPWSLLAAVAQQDPKLAAVVGEQISAELKMQGSLLAPAGQLKINSSQIKTDLQLVSTDDALVIKQGSFFTLDVNAQGWKVWTADSQTQLLAPVQIRAQVNEFILPKLKTQSVADPVASAIQFNLPAAKASVDLSISDVKLQGSDSMGQLALTGTKAALKSEQLGRNISLTFEADASRNQQTGNLRLSATANDLADAQGQLGLSRVNAQVQATASHLPLVVLDEVLGLGNMLAGVLGDELEAKASASIKPSADGATASGPFEVTMTTSQFNMQLAGKLSPESLELDPTSTAVLTLTPAGATAAGLPADMLLSPAKIQLAIQKAVIPRSEQGLLVEQGKINATLTTSPIALAGRGEVKQLGMTGVKLSFASEAIGKLISVDAQATAQADALNGTMTANARVANLMAGESKQAEPMSVTFDVATKDLPLAAADALAGQTDVLTLWLGSALNMHASGKMQSDAQGQLQGSVAFKANSPQLVVDTHAKLQAGVLLVDPSSQIKLTLLDRAMAQQGVELAEPLVLTVTLGDISLPVSPMNLEAATITNLSIHTTPVRFTGEMAKTGYELSAMEGKVIATPLGEKLTLNLQGKALRNGAADSPIVIQADVRQPLGDHMQAKANVSLSNVAVAVLDAIAKQDGLLLAVLGPELSSLKMTLDSGTSVTPAPAPAPTTAAVPPAASPWTVEVSAQSTNLTVPGLKGQITPGVAAVLNKSQPMTLRVTPQSYARLMRPALEIAEADATSSPVSQIKGQLKSKTGSSISKLLGAILPKASAKEETNVAANEPFVLDGAFDVVLTIEAGRMDLTEPQFATTTATTTTTVSKVEPTATPMDLHGVSGALTLEVSRLAYVRENDGQRAAMNNVKTHVVATKSVADEVLITVTGDTLATPGKQAAAAPADKDAATQIPPANETSVVDASRPVAGQINAKIRLNKLAMLPEGGVDFYHMDSHWDVDVKKMPSQILDELASQQGMLAGMLGGTVDLLLKGDMPGNLDLNLQAPLATIEGLLTVTPQRVVLLREDLKMQLVATPESVAVMGLLNPQLLALESTRAPIKLVVEKEGFSLPLPSPGQALAVTQIQSNLKVELGQVKLRKEGMVKDVFEVLSGFGGIFKKEQIMDVTFTPLDVTMKQGQVKTNDMWLISSDLMMGTQATIDMNRTPAFATMYLGLSGQTLAKLPGARSNIPSDQVVDIKLAAPLSQIKVDHTLLIAQLTPLFVTAYGGKDAQKILKGVNQGISILEKLSGQQPSASNVSWLNHPKPAVTSEAVVPASGATTQPQTEPVPATQPAEKPADATPAAEPDLEESVKSLIDLFKKDKKEKKK